MRDVLREMVDKVLANGIDAESRCVIEHALALGYSPLVVLRVLSTSGGLKCLDWLAVEAVMVGWCRAELRRIVEGTARGSAEWRRVRRWLFLLNEADCVEIDATFDIRHPGDLDGKEG